MRRPHWFIHGRYEPGWTAGALFPSFGCCGCECNYFYFLYGLCVEFVLQLIKDTINGAAKGARLAADQNRRHSRVSHIDYALGGAQQRRYLLLGGMCGANVAYLVQLSRNVPQWFKYANGVISHKGLRTYPVH